MYILIFVCARMCVCVFARVCMFYGRVCARMLVYLCVCVHVYVCLFVCVCVSVHAAGMGIVQGVH